MYVPFGYLKQVLDPKIKTDSRSINSNRSSPEFDKLRPDFLEDYPDAKEKVDPGFFLSPSFGPFTEITIWVTLTYMVGSRSTCIFHQFLIWMILSTYGGRIEVKQL